MPDTEYSREDVAARGEEVYEHDIRAHVESQHRGEYLVLDIESGQYEIDEDDLAATKRLIAKRPQAVVYGLRIGYSAAYRLGGFSKVSVDD